MTLNKLCCLWSKQKLFRSTWWNCMNCQIICGGSLCFWCANIVIEFGMMNSFPVLCSPMWVWNVTAILSLLILCTGIWSNWQERAWTTSRAYRFHYSSILKYGVGRLQERILLLGICNKSKSVLSVFYFIITLVALDIINCCSCWWCMLVFF